MNDQFEKDYWELKNFRSTLYHSLYYYTGNMQLFPFPVSLVTDALHRQIDLCEARMANILKAAQKPSY